MESIELKLTLPEVNQVLEALGQMPYARIFELVAKIQQQASSQLQAPAGGPAAAEAPNPNPES